MAIDLISLYKDGAASEDSKKAIQEHLKTCKSCARIYRQYSQDTTMRAKSNDLKPSKGLEEKYKLLAEDLHKKKISDTISMAAVITVSVAAGIFLLLKNYYENPDRF